MCRGVILVFAPEGCCRREGVTEQTKCLVNSSSCLWHGCVPSSLKVKLVTSSSDLSAPCTHFGGRIYWGYHPHLFTCGWSPSVSIVEQSCELAVWAASVFFCGWFHNLQELSSHLRFSVLVIVNSFVLPPNVFTLSYKGNRHALSFRKFQEVWSIQETEEKGIMILPLSIIHL